MIVIPYIHKGKKVYDNEQLCYEAFLLMNIERTSDRLSENYSYKNLKLESMYNYTFVFDGDNPVQASGSQILSSNVCRVFSRYYAFNDYRTDGTNLLEKADDFVELKWTLETLNHFPLIIWSRDKGDGFFRRLKKNRPDIFSDWQIYPEKIELMYENNYQSIFYLGDVTHLHNLQYEFYSREKH